MAVTQEVLLEQDLLRIVSRADESSEGRVYLVEIDGRETLHSFSTFEAARQFVAMLAPDSSPE
ncbi:hypothetical protein C8D92_106161 [Tamilnaduibacter salinus]|uniref:Uncharacterized protein n=1 Tax=Tamilnaduibacter salinus TaxID=1484056 RepID=A0A2U1CW16_9GAMM|nr:hypothetical protein [Tamilnaduibacter salinus]PVY75900.1 hypothetical protein C8D92_106161 [Tamilnaduibacter salinus]